ncbi:MAG: hypothetical protein ACYDA0_13705 [Candidatus Dormibacteraceae bacterium]
MKAYVIALMVLVGVLGGFYGGYKVGQNNVSASSTTRAVRAGGLGGGFTGGRGIGAAAACPSPGATPTPGTQAFARGTITDLASTSLTVTNTNCDVKITFGPTVTVSKTEIGSTSDFQDNQTVAIIGTRQADGTILAQTIQIGPAGAGAIRGGAGTGSGSGTGGGG